jgi:competence protein ComGC
MNKAEKPKQNQRTIKDKGITLFEVLLYIGLFSILCVSMIYLYISIVKTADSVKLSLQRVEISLFVREIVRYKLDNQDVTSNTPISPITPEDFDRIMKFYPNLELLLIKVENINIHFAKIEYLLVHKSINNLSEKSFMQTMYIRRL